MSSKHKYSSLTLNFEPKDSSFSPLKIYRAFEVPGGKLDKKLSGSVWECVKAR